MSIKVRVNTCFQILPEDLRHFKLKPYYDIKMANWWNVEHLRAKLLQVWNLTHCTAEFYTDWFDVGRLNGDDKFEDGATVFAVISLKIKESDTNTK